MSNDQLEPRDNAPQPAAPPRRRRKYVPAVGPRLAKLLFVVFGLFALLAVNSVYLVGVSILLVATPFERLEPLLVLPGQSLSSAEVVLGAIGLVWLTAVARSCQRPVWRTPLTMPWLVFLATMVLAAVLAPVHQSNALNMAWLIV